MFFLFSHAFFFCLFDFSCSEMCSPCPLLLQFKLTPRDCFEDNDLMMKEIRTVLLQPKSSPLERGRTLTVKKFQCVQCNNVMFFGKLTCIGVNAEVSKPYYINLPCGLKCKELTRAWSILQRDPYLLHTSEEFETLAVRRLLKQIQEIMFTVFTSSSSSYHCAKQFRWQCHQCLTFRLLKLHVKNNCLHFCSI